jgi:hypothetical protein
MYIAFLKHSYIHAQRLQVLGLTNPLTQFGFAVAFVLITLNTVLGTGWLGDLMGINQPIVILDSGGRDVSQPSGNSIDSIRFNSKELDNNLDKILLDMEQNNRR